MFLTPLRNKTKTFLPFIGISSHFSLYCSKVLTEPTFLSVLDYPYHWLLLTIMMVTFSTCCLRWIPWTRCIISDLSLVHVTVLCVRVLFFYDEALIGFFCRLTSLHLFLLMWLLSHSVSWSIMWSIFGKTKVEESETLFTFMLRSLLTCNYYIMFLFDLVWSHISSYLTNYKGFYWLF